jgi:hypothetical protein
MRWLVLLFVAACIPVPPPVYRVQRTARVPHPAAPLRSGEPLEGPAELSIGASSFGDTRAPRLADPAAAVEVPTTQMRGEARFRILRGEIAAITDHAIEATMQPIDRTQAPVSAGTAWSVGLATRYSIELPDTHLSIGLGLEALRWNIPYVEYRSCVANCDGAPLQEMLHGSEMIGTLAYSITPSYRAGALAIFGGLYAAQHPTIVRKGTELYATDYNSDVDHGDYNYILHAGVEVHLGYVSVIAQVQDDVTRSPLAYGPSFGFALAAHTPEIPRPPPPRYAVPIEPDDRPW